MPAYCGQKGGLPVIKKKRLMFTMLLFMLFVPAVSSAVPSGQIITWEDGSQGAVKFEGEEHAEKGYKCEACHPSLFQMKKGSAKITMPALDKGQFCGYCHNGKTAFATDDPGKCHECHKKEKRHHEENGHH
jgi:c(7)-type cytochrome triheme protein